MQIEVRGPVEEVREIPGITLQIRPKRWILEIQTLEEALQTFQGREIKVSRRSPKRFVIRKDHDKYGNPRTPQKYEARKKYRRNMDSWFVIRLLDRK